MFVKNVAIFTLCSVVVLSTVGCETDVGTGLGVEVSDGYFLLMGLLGAGSSEARDYVDKTVKMKDVKNFMDVCYQSETTVSATIIYPNTNDAGRYTERFLDLDEEENFVWFRTFISFGSREGPSLAEGYLIYKTNTETGKKYIVELFAEPLV